MRTLGVKGTKNVSKQQRRVDFLHEAADRRWNEAFDTGSKIRAIRSRKRRTLGTIRRDKHLILTVPKLVIVAQADSLIGRKTNYEITQDSLQLHAHNVMKSARKNIAI